MKQSSSILALLLLVGAADASAEAARPAERRALFGELHLHTVMSFDAWTFGTKLTPDEAYKFARGETVMVPAVQVRREQGIDVTKPVAARRAWPLDFTAVTDHSEYIGAMTELDDPASQFSKSEIGQELHAGGRRAFLKLASGAFGGNAETRALLAGASEAADAWNIEIKAANDNYEPGKFTTFIAYEWSASAGYGTHIHRNVIFSGDHAPAPFTSIDSSNPEDLWRYLGSVRAQGLDVIAIPHNSNLSDGHDFDWNMSDGRPIDEAYAQARALNEPLVEIAQTKGTSETTPELSPNDEFAGFEIMDRLYRGETEPVRRGSYVRDAWGRGLVIGDRIGTNPFKMGVVGASDIHNGLSASDEDAYAGRISGLDPATMMPTGEAVASELSVKPEDLGTRPTGQRENDPLQFASAAVTGVWAEDNTRESIFAALKRKETFATSGTRLRLRMFAGWHFSSGAQERGWVARAYREGVAMGSDLPAMPRSAKAPQFVLEAQKDPDGANLDRIQVIKVWLEGGDYREQVYDVVLAGEKRRGADGRVLPVGNTVDLKTGEYTNAIGAPILRGSWQDPDFDPARPAVYYARALEIPTARWSTLLALRNNLPIPDRVSPTLQERAWSSPVWYTPGK